MRRPARDRDPESCKSSRDSFVVCLDGRLRGQKIRPAVMDDDNDATVVVVVNVFCPSRQRMMMTVWRAGEGSVLNSKLIFATLNYCCWPKMAMILWSNFHSFEPWFNRKIHPPGFIQLTRLDWHFPSWSYISLDFICTTITRIGLISIRLLWSLLHVYIIIILFSFQMMMLLLLLQINWDQCLWCVGIVCPAYLNLLVCLSTVSRAWLNRKKESFPLLGNIPIKY